MQAGFCVRSSSAATSCWSSPINCWRMRLPGTGQTLFLSGQAGLGKTRLLRAIVRKAEAAGLRVDGGSVAPQDHQVPLASIREMATGMRGNAEWGSLSQDLLAIDGHHDGDALGARRLMVRATADRILEAIDRPTMLVFEDLHWTDEMSLEVIGELARHAAGTAAPPDRRLPGGRVPGGHDPPRMASATAQSALGRGGAAGPLTRDQTSMATTLILGGELPAQRDVVEAVFERTNGIPLHIEELLAALDDDARADGRRIRDAHVPDTIGDAVLARVAQLSGDAQAVARAGAVVGRCFTPEVLAGIIDRPLRELEPTLQELVDAASSSIPVHRPGLLRLPPPAPAGCDLQLRAAVGTAPLPRPGRGVRHDPGGVEHRPRVAALRARGAPVPGIRRRTHRSARGEQDFRPPRGVRALPAGHCEHAR